MSLKRFSLSMRARLWLLALLPLGGLLTVGGLYVYTLNSELQEHHRDLQTMTALEAEISLDLTLSSRLKQERDQALRLLATPGLDSSGFDAAAAATDVEITKIQASMDRLSTGRQGAFFEERAKLARDIMGGLLPETRNAIRKREVTPAKMLSAYVKTAFAGLYMPECYRSLLLTPETFNTYDGIMTMVKIREQEMLVNSLIVHGHAQGKLARDEIAVVRKQFFALTESEYYLRKFYPSLRTELENIGKEEPRVPAYYAYLTTIAGTQREGEPLPDFSIPWEKLPEFVTTKNSLYLGLIAKGFAVNQNETKKLIHKHLVASLLIEGTLGVLLIASVITCILVVRSTNRRLGTTASGIETSSADIDAASGQLKNASEMISRNASTEAAAIEEISASVHELSAIAEGNKDHAGHARDDAAKAREAVTAGLKSMKELSATMESVAASSKKITQVLRRINDISF